MSAGKKESAWPIPPHQHPHEAACSLAFDALAVHEPSPEKLNALGAKLESGYIVVSVLSRVVLVDLTNRRVCLECKYPIRQAWALLVLHYLCAENISLNVHEVSLSYFDDCRGYMSVFENRVIGRFLATVGRTEKEFEDAAKRIGGSRIDMSGCCYRFYVLPRVPISFIRYEGDEELKPGANVLYRADAGNLLPAEDRIVAAELLLKALEGLPIELTEENVEK